MNTKNNVSIEKAKNNKTAAIAIVTVALALSMMSAAANVRYHRIQMDSIL